MYRGVVSIGMCYSQGGRISYPPVEITYVNADNSPVHVTVLLIESTSPLICRIDSISLSLSILQIGGDVDSISRTVTCTGELSALK